MADRKDESEYAFHCPNCGLATPMELVIAHAEAREAVLRAMQVSGPLGESLLRYLGLFRSQKRQALRMSRVAELVNALLPDIRAGRITRKGQEYPAPPEAFISAIKRMLDYRDAGRLTLPMKNHGYLYDVITDFREEERPTTLPTTAGAGQRTGAPSKTMSGVSALERLKQEEDWLLSEIARGLQKLLLQRLPGAPPEDAIIGTCHVWREAFVSRRIAWEEALDRQRIAAAFSALLRSAEQWPMPKTLFENMGSRRPIRQTETPEAVEELSDKEMMEKHQRLLREYATGGKHPANTEAPPQQKAYADNGEST
uniref:Uncharacterized protein n=1 Tax=Candidatus Kentrum sp. LPFa TaxID=2126335 RepID=A0A450WDG0_9GAMM|nr:MAG: hypothetical protein BECKLPF1236B_GA0070989_107121 [Candidatus Kentron sp. LPFa]